MLLLTLKETLFQYDDTIVFHAIDEHENDYIGYTIKEDTEFVVQVSYESLMAYYDKQINLRTLVLLNHKRYIANFINENELQACKADLIDEFLPGEKFYDNSRN